MHMFMVVLVSLALRTITGALWLPGMAAPESRYTPSVFVQDDVYLYFPASEDIGSCSPQTRKACSEYAYLAVEHILGRPPTFAEILAITYRGEFGAPNATAAQATARNWFDSQAGAMRYHDGQYTLTYDSLMGWLGNLQLWIDSVRMMSKGEIVKVNYARLLGIPLGRDEHGNPYPARYPLVQTWLMDQIAGHLRWWRSGQGVAVPSIWGLTCVMPGQQLEGVIFRQRVVGTCGSNGEGRLISIIVPTSNRHAVWGGS